MLEADAFRLQCCLEYDCPAFFFDVISGGFSSLDLIANIYFIVFAPLTLVQFLLHSESLGCLYMLMKGAF